MITKKQLENIRKKSVFLCWNVSFGGKAKGNKHLFRVAKMTTNLAKKENARVDVCEAGAWLHDIGLSKNIQSKSYKGIDLAKKILLEENINKKDIDLVLECVKCHDGYYKTNLLEAKIVHDSDTLDKTGALGIIRETWKRSQMGWNSEKIGLHLENHFLKREHNLYTAAAQKIANQNNKKLKEFFKQLKSQVV